MNKRICLVLATVVSVGVSLPVMAGGAPPAGGGTSVSSSVFTPASIPSPSISAGTTTGAGGGAQVALAGAPGGVVGITIITGAPGTGGPPVGPPPGGVAAFLAQGGSVTVAGPNGTAVTLGGDGD